MSRGRVVLAFVHPGQTSALFTVSLVATVRADAVGPRRIETVLQLWSSANVAEARNRLVDRFLDDCRGEWFLSADSDMEWTPDALDRLLEAADPERAPIVGGLCFGLAHDELFPTMYDAVQDDAGDIVFQRRTDFPPDAMVQVSATGAAFLLVHRRVLLAMRERGFNRAFPYFQETETGGTVSRIVGEDLTFCVRAGLLGFSVYVHTGVEVGHHKSQVLNAAMYAAQRARATQARPDLGTIEADGVRHGESALGPAPGPAQHGSSAPAGPAAG